MNLQNFTTLRVMLTGILTLFSLAFSLPAAANVYPCAHGPGPNEVQVGMTPSGNGIASIALCTSNASSASSRSSESEGTAKVLESYREVIALKSPSNIWSFPPVENGVCSAVFNANEGLVVIRAPQTKMATKPPSLTFWSRNVPRNLGQPAEVVNISFENGPTNGKKITQTVRAIYVPNIGEYVLSIPTNKVLLNSIEDRMTFKLSVGGRAMVALDWIDGNMAKAKLAQCLNI